MSPYFYVNSLVLLPPQKWWVTEKKVQTPFYIPCSRHTLYRYILCYTNSFVKLEFPNIWISTTNIFLRKLFPQFLVVIFPMWVLIRISDVSQERGSDRFILRRPDTNSYVLPSSSKIPLPLKVGEYPAVARQWVREPTYAKYSPIYIHLLRVGWKHFFSSCVVLSVFDSGRK